MLTGDMYARPWRLWAGFWDVKSERFAGVFYKTTRMSAQIQEDRATLERIFLTRDRAYCVELMHGIFASNTEASRLMTSRLLASIYEYKGQQSLSLKGLSREKRVQHYLEQVGRHVRGQSSAMIY